MSDRLYREGRVFERSGQQMFSMGAIECSGCRGCGPLRSDRNGELIVSSVEAEGPARLSVSRRAFNTVAALAFGFPVLALVCAGWLVDLLGGSAGLSAAVGVAAGLSAMLISAKFLRPFQVLLHPEVEVSKHITD